MQVEKRWNKREQKGKNERNNVEKWSEVE
jgi:hypothetical protein